jgi:predicted lysophospholipase L1 biosynthesis ABC-type transport system permease subunit
LPQRADEVVLGPRTLRDAHVHVGGRIVLAGDRPGVTRTMTITGSGLVPSGPHNDYFDGGWVTTAGYQSLFRRFKFHLQLVRVRHGLDPHREAARLTKYLATAVPGAGADVEVPTLPVEASLIRQVERLPVFLGGFLAVLAVAAVGHALASAVRRRAHDLAVLRALGMTRAQCRLVVVTHASVIALLGLAFGLPIGLALGRTVWRVVADYTPVEYVPPLDITVLALIGPAAIGLANLLAAWPARRAARLRVAHVLRAE